MAGPLCLVQEEQQGCGWALQREPRTVELSSEADVQAGGGTDRSYKKHQVLGPFKQFTAVIGPNGAPPYPLPTRPSVLRRLVRHG
jgi:hypothetical protein